MKSKILVIALILINFIAFSQIDSNKTLSGFWGIDFGSSMVKAKSIMNSKSGCEISEASNSNQLVYTGGSFAGNNIYIVSLKFYNDKFYNGVVYVKPSSGSILSVYNGIIENLTTKYSDPDKVIENYEYPYKKGDEDYETAIKVGKALIASRWYFDNSSITISVSKNLSIMYNYIQNEIGNIVDKNENIKKLNDL